MRKGRLVERWLGKATNPTIRTHQWFPEKEGVHWARQSEADPELVGVDQRCSHLEELLRV